MNPNPQQVTSVLRLVLAAILSPLLAKGVVDDSMVTVLASALAELALFAWGVWENTHAKQVQSVTNIHPGVEVLVPHAVTNDNQAINDMVTDPLQPQVRLRPPEPPSSKPPDLPKAA